MKYGIKIGGWSTGKKWVAGKIILPMINTSLFHTPVLLPDVINLLNVKKGKKYIDATIGGGGYTDEILKLGGIVLGIDADMDAIEYVKNKIEARNTKFEINKQIFLVHGNFANLKEIAYKFGFEKAAGIIFDLGMSSFQLEKSGRGFSFERNESLDMRMDTKGPFDAGELLNTYSEDRLYEIFSIYAEELHSRAIAQAIVRTHSLKKGFTRTGDLAKVIGDVLNKIYASKQGDTFRIYQRTKARIFQSIRIAVNNEMENLELGLNSGIDLLDAAGRIVVLSYHSLEDRKVKMNFRKRQLMNKLELIKFPLMASNEEITANSRARSVKLRVAQRKN